MIKFNSTAKIHLLRLYTSMMCALIKKIKKNEELFLNNAVPDSGNMVWPDGFVNEVAFIFSPELNLISLQGKLSGIIINDEKILVSASGRNFLQIDMNIQKDDYFNYSLSNELYGISYEDIQYLISLRERIYETPRLHYF